MDDAAIDAFPNQPGKIIKGALEIMDQMEVSTLSREVMLPRLNVYPLD